MYIDEVIQDKQNDILSLEEEAEDILQLMNAYDHSDVDFQLLETELEIVRYQLKSYRKLVKNLENTKKKNNMGD